ncbi:hypothetical protein AFK68_27555 [Hydrocoleum sp. CS-953]|uniref:M10 family metallopeptidase C-terminal domain-containing protein n=1 Tax=Hydrocoleum sp. CS-953 TaxID=1671698 RepID=UPI000B9BC27D|nr:hypothetical protein AFK68_27555 [Hydrocoleum sp. CS-953]
MNDRLIGGNGKDTFRLASGDGTDIIVDFKEGFDKIDLVDLSSNDLDFVASGSNTLLKVTATGEVLAQLNNVSVADLSSSDFF